MACFVVPAAEAIVTTAITKIIEKKEKENPVEAMEIKQSGERFSVKLNRLNYLLWGGSVLLAFEHVWHGEVQPFAPFLTAAANPADLSEMLTEMSTVGVGMAVLTTCVWGVMTFVLHKMEKTAENKTMAAAKKER